VFFGDIAVCSLISWLPSSAYEKAGEVGGGAEYQSALGGSVTVYVDNGRSLAGPTLGGAGYSRVWCRFLLLMSAFNLLNN